MTPEGVFFCWQGGAERDFVNSATVGRIFRRFVSAPMTVQFSLYHIVGIITIWFSQNTTYNFIIRQEMW